jgi:hypothetical protein
MRMRMRLRAKISLLSSFVEASRVAFEPLPTGHRPPATGRYRIGFGKLDLGETEVTLSNDIVDSACDTFCKKKTAAKKSV